MNREHDIIVVRIAPDDTGLYVLESAELTGVHVAHRDPERIIADMPDIIRLWFKRHRGEDVEVFQGPIKRADHEYAIPAVTVPAEIAAAALGR